MAIRIKRLRQRAGLTQEQLARACHVSRSAVALWETDNTKTLKPEHLFAAADALGVDPKYLATGREPVASGLTELPQQTRLMLEAYTRLPMHLQEQVSALVKMMAVSPEHRQMQSDQDEIARGRKKN